MKEFVLSDETIGQVAKVLQLAILTGTDIVDNLRQMKFSTDDEKIILSADYKANFDKWVSTMLEKAANQAKQEVNSTDQLTLF